LVVAMIALFVALTGTAVATTSALITGNQIKNNSITGLDVRNRSLRPIDFRGSVRGPRGLRGLTGATGATGAPGAAGAKGDKGDKGDPGTPAAKYFARVEYSGTTASVPYGTPGVTAVRSGLGFTTVTFPTDVSQCVTSAMVFHVGGEGFVRKGTGSSGPNVLTQVRDHAGAAQDWGFDIAVFC
jgi:hypothetical protein